jgi:RNA polymerase sigma-70 factor (ECF subfamily)
MISAQHDRVEHDPTLGEPDEVLRPMGPVIEAALTENHRTFLRFLVRRLGDQSAAEDVLQSFCLRAVRKGAELRDSESVIAWLYSVLRSVLMDHYRSEAARRRRDSCYAQEQIVLGNDRDDVELEESVCNCFRGLLPALRPDYAEVLRRVDLSGNPREKVAADLGITPANVRVRLHRARQALRKALGDCCGSCCEHGFRDCDCEGAHSHTDLAPNEEATIT